MNNTNDPIRRLTHALLISGGFNILLLAALFYFFIKETPPRPYFELKPADKEEMQPPLANDQTNSSMLREFRLLPMEQLLIRLTNTQLVENGYTQRDLALAALVAFHHFDLPRALIGQAQPTQQRKIPLGRNRKGEWVEAIVYAGLSDQQFQSIIKFANTEQWPLTSFGLYRQICKKAENHEQSLEDAFYLMPEFIAVETLFSRSEIRVERSELLKILCQGNWLLLSKFAEQQRAVQDLSAARRQKFLLDYIAHGSKAAAYLILKTDGTFIALKLDDKYILTILNLLDEKTKAAEQFALILLTSPRSDAVRQMAAARLYEYSGDLKPENDLHHAALLRFAPQTITSKATPIVASSTKPVAKAPLQVKTNIQPKTQPKVQTKPQTKPQPKTQLKPQPKNVNVYVVQEGDSLWKISKRFKVDVEVLKTHNNLQSDFLKPGTILKIP